MAVAKATDEQIRKDIRACADLIWGNSSTCMINGHEFRRIMQLWDGSEEVL